MYVNSSVNIIIVYCSSYVEFYILRANGEKLLVH